MNSINLRKTQRSHTSEKKYTVIKRNLIWFNNESFNALTDLLRVNNNNMSTKCCDAWVRFATSFNYCQNSERIRNKILPTV